MSNESISVPSPTDDAALRASALLRSDIVADALEGDLSLARQHIASNDTRVMITALRCLAKTGELPNDGFATLATSTDERQRRAAAELGAEYKDVDLLTLLRDADNNVSECAAWALGERYQPSDNDAIENACPSEVVQALGDVTINHEDAITRESAVASLGAIGDREGLVFILQACSDKATVRRRAVLALASYEGDDVDVALKKAKLDRDWQVRQAAQDIAATDL